MEISFAEYVITIGKPKKSSVGTECIDYHSVANHRRFYVKVGMLNSYVLDRLGTHESFGLSTEGDARRLARLLNELTYVQ